MQPRVSKAEYEEWRSSLITEELFNFFKLEAELHRRTCLELDTSKSFPEIGQEYYKRLFAAQCYEMLDNIQFEDIFPKEEHINDTHNE